MAKRTGDKGQEIGVGRAVFGLVALIGLWLVACAPTDFQRREALWPGGAPGARGSKIGDTPELFYYLPAQGKANGAAAIVAPGGSYAHTGGLRVEAFPTARWLAEQGFVAVVLRYRVSGDGYAHRDFLADGKRAVQRVRAQAGELGVDPAKIGMIGFSAGGHLAGFVGNECPKQGDAAAGDAAAGDAATEDATGRASCRPDWVVMVYPVVTLDDRWAHQRSKRSMLGEEAASPELLQKLSLEQRATADSPPAFLVHSRRDSKVLFHNSELYYEALRPHGVPAELKLYDDGRHGVGLAQKSGMPQMAKWPQEMLAWLKAIGVTK